MSGLLLMKDLYSLLNVPRNADPEVIKRAYRKLAKKLHPDRNFGDPGMEQRFKDITQAYHLLSDQKARRDYDRGRIDASGQPKRPPFGRAGARDQDDGWWNQGVETIFDRMFGKFGRAGGGQTRFDPEPSSGSQATGREGRHGSGRNGGQDRDQYHRLEVDFLTAILGGKQRMTPIGGAMLEIDIPPGTADNTRLRLRGQGSSGHHGKGPSDLLVHIRVLDHPLFTRRGQDLHLDLPVSLKEALLGARVRTPTIEGAVWLNIPAKANSGQTLRLKGKGVADRAGKRGDQYVRLMVMLPKDPGAAMAADLGRLAEHDDYDVRAHLDNP